MMSVGERDTPGRAPERSCVGCRARAPQDRLIRLRLQGGRIVPAMSAAARRISGRSAYLCPRGACVRKAVERRVFTRAFSSRRRARSVQALDLAGAEQLWSDATEQIRCEIETIDRSSENPHANTRRPGLERLLFELSSQPIPPDRRPRSSGQGAAPTHG